MSCVGFSSDTGARLVWLTGLRRELAWAVSPPRWALAGLQGARGAHAVSMARGADRCVCVAGLEASRTGWTGDEVW